MFWNSDSPYNQVKSRLCKQKCFCTENVTCFMPTVDLEILHRYQAHVPRGKLPLQFEKVNFRHPVCFSARGTMKSIFRPFNFLAWRNRYLVNVRGLIYTACTQSIMRKDWQLNPFLLIHNADYEKRNLVLFLSFFFKVEYQKI